jgi:DOPA 4,5-dioxygenase
MSGPVQDYHAHIYFDAATQPVAMLVREGLARFEGRMGRVHEAPVGPHTRGMFQFAFAPAQFAAVVPWLMLNRRGLSILLHPETGRPRDDHSLHAAWMGPPLALKLEILPETDSAVV